MYYRLSCIIDSGEIRGHQWREIDQDLFVAIATGQRPQGDEDAQIRNSSEVDSSFDDSTVYYGHVWFQGWVTDLTTEKATALYDIAGFDQPGY